MRSRILFEFEDLSWFPDPVRRGMTDYLRQLFELTGFYDPVIPVVDNAIKMSGSTRIVDLCSGGGGPLRELVNRINVPALLTDLYPNLTAFRHLREESGGRIDFVEERVDATNVPAHLTGLRTIFSGAHHFNTGGVAAILRDAARHRQPVAIFDGGNKTVLTILAIVLGHPLLMAVTTPFMKPVTISRLLFTYAIPLIPLCTVWDGVVSIIRLHRPPELHRIAEAAGTDYQWTHGTVRNRLGFKIGYLVGWPAGRAR